MQWNQPTEKKLTGGTNWQARTSTSTTWNPVSIPPAPQMVMPSANIFTENFVFISLIVNILAFQKESQIGP